MKINAKQEPQTKLDFGCIFYSGTYNETYLIVEGFNEEYPISLINLKTNKVYDEYNDWSSVRTEFGCYKIYEPEQITLNLG